VACRGFLQRLDSCVTIFKYNRTRMGVFTGVVVLRHGSEITSGLTRYYSGPAYQSTHLSFVQSIYGLHLFSHLHVLVLNVLINLAPTRMSTLAKMAGYVAIPSKESLSFREYLTVESYSECLEAPTPSKDYMRRSWPWVLHLMVFMLSLSAGLLARTTQNCATSRGR